MSKKIKVILFIYLFQAFASGCNPCSCPPVMTYERIYNDIELKAWDTSGSQIEEVNNLANRSAFSLSVSIQFELNEITYNKSSFNISSFGFSAAYACSCGGNEYINVDPIDTVEIMVIDVDTGMSINVTNQFSVYNYSGNQVSLDELFENLADGQDEFQFDLTNYENIPDASIFSVKIHLESGVILSKETQQINFEN